MDFELRDDEHLAIIGPNGGGKTILAQTISGGLFLRSGTLEFGFRDGSASPARNICYASFADAYGTEYYQQRWNASDIDGLPTVCEPVRRPETQRKGIRKSRSRCDLGTNARSCSLRANCVSFI
ncbi:MAG: ATP-binding cassette domain-containing protein [Alistipes putredinis]|nr:MAG: ATP-binding cassette domain-containing protein [Alistipes putredinis]